MDDKGLHITMKLKDGKSEKKVLKLLAPVKVTRSVQILDVDTVIVCAGQVSLR